MSVERLPRSPSLQGFPVFGIFRGTNRHGFEAWLSRNRHHEHDVQNITTKVFSKARILSLFGPDGPKTKISNLRTQFAFPLR